MIKKIFFAFIGMLLLAGLTRPIKAQEKEVYIHFFWANGCPHCQKEKTFLGELEKKYPVKVKDYEVSGSRENVELLQRVGKKLSVDVSGVPFTLVGEHYFVGYHSDETTGSQIEEAVECALQTGCSDIVSQLTPPLSSASQGKIPEVMKLPLVGEIKTASLSLPALTFLIALLDGFNPCAMWVLLFLISLLLGMKDRNKMWILGTAFIVSSALVYFLFLSAWLNLFLFLGFVFWVRVMIGLVSVGLGGYQVREFFVNKTGGCKVAGGEKRKLIFEKLKEITQKKDFLIALGGIILLAFAVNLVELVCSAGLPAIYTQVLALSNLPSWQYYLYLILYILVFMADDLFVFFVAMKTLQATGVSSKYARFSHLVGGSIIILIGLSLLFKPELLMFG
jgi:thiol-disulfide isomerase/thioredoxin